MEQVIDLSDTSIVSATATSSKISDVDEDDENKKMARHVEKDHQVLKFYSCNFCMKTFTCSQALAGHQRAHKSERSLAKAWKALDTPVIRYPYCPYMQKPYWITAAPPSHRSFRRSFGVFPASKIHKPYYRWSFPGYQYSHGVLPPNAMMNRPQPAVKRMRMEDNSHGRAFLGGLFPSSMVSITDVNKARLFTECSHETHSNEEHELDLTLKL